MLSCRPLFTLLRFNKTHLVAATLATSLCHPMTICASSNILAPWHSPSQPKHGPPISWGFTAQCACSCRDMSFLCTEPSYNCDIPPTCRLGPGTTALFLQSWESPLQVVTLKCWSEHHMPQWNIIWQEHGSSDRLFKDTSVGMNELHEQS